MGQIRPFSDPAPLRIVIGEAETQASSIEDVVRFLRQQEADDLADLLLTVPANGRPQTLSEFCARMEALCAMV